MCKIVVVFLYEKQALKKTFKKLDHDVNIQDFLGSRYRLALKVV